MAAGCKKCDPHEICEECPEWIFTLADLIMCMMGLFVILWVLKPGLKEQKPEQNDDWIKVVAAIRDAFGYLPDPMSKDPVDIQMLMQKIQTMPPMKGPGDGGKTKLEKHGAEGTDPEVTSIRKGRQATVGSRLLFDVGSAEITPDVKKLLDDVAGVIRGHRNITLVKGHASLDDARAPNLKGDVMALSYARAKAVRDYLIKQGVDADVLRVQGCATYEPVSQRAYNEEGQAANRRVEVESTANLVEDLQDKAVPAALGEDGTSLTGGAGAASAHGREVPHSAEASAGHH